MFGFKGSKRNNRKSLSCLIIALMLFSMLPAGAWANEHEPPSETLHPDPAAGLAGARLYEAVVLPDQNIGAVFNISGSILYGILDIAENRWTTVNLGTTASTDVNAASLALDAAGQPHIVFVNTDNDLVYRYFDGSAWTTGTSIDSLNIGEPGPGILSSPDVAIDAAGKAHIAYIDSRGGSSPGREHFHHLPDLMYATNVTGQFVVTVRQYGDGWFEASTHHSWHTTVAPPKISLTATESPIGSVFFRRTRSGTGAWSIIWEHFYRIYHSTPPELEISLGYFFSDPGSPFSLFDMETDGISTFSLFRNVNNLYLKNGITMIPGTNIIFPASTADLFVNTSGHLYYAAVSASTLHLYQDGAFKGPLTLPAALSTSHSKVATVVIGTDQYVLYTDDAGRLQIISYKTAPDANAPVNSIGFPRVTNVSASGFTVEAMVDESASIFYIVVDHGSPAPTSPEVISGANYGAVSLRVSGNFEVLPNSMNSRAITGLAADTGYDVYVVARDREGNMQDSPVLIEVAATPALTPVSLTSIPGVTAPATGALPVTAIAPTTQYTGDVTWTPALAADGTFAPGTTYTATIELTAKPGFTFDGVTANFFAVAGATTVTNLDGSGVITAVFPATSPADPVVVPVTSVTVTPEMVTMNVYGNQSLTVTVTPTNATNKAVNWTSSNTDVATVDADGLVTAHSAGTATITVTTADGGHTATSAIIVAALPELPAPAGNITGTVTDGEYAVPGAEVHAVWQDAYGDWWSAGEATTGEDGRFTITNLTIGTYNLWVYPPAETYYVFTVAEGVDIERDKTTDHGSIALQLGGAVSGMVTDGVYAVPGAEVYAVWQDAYGNWWSAGEAITGEDGGFTIWNLPVAIYDLWIYPPPDTYLLPAAFEEVTVSAGVTTNILEPLVLLDETLVTVGSVSGAPGDTVLVDIAIDEPYGMAGGQFALHYDPEIAVATKVYAGEVLDGFEIVDNLQEAANGSISVAWASVEAATAGGTLLQVAFELKAVGETVIELQNLELNDIYGEIIPATATDGEITVVAALPEPPAPPVLVTGVKVTPGEASINVGDTQQLTAAVLPADATNKDVAWSSDDETVATVDGNGLVTAVGVGTATITTTTADGGHTATSVITVEDPVIGADVTGRVDLPGRRDDSGVTTTVAGTDISAVSIADGSFTLDSVPAGEQMLVFAKKLFLARTLTVEVPATGTLELSDVVTLNPGDANADNRVNILDLTLLARAFRATAADTRYNANTDFNADGRVNILDLTLLAGSFRAVGDTIPS